MTNKPKSQGTRFESRIVKDLNARHPHSAHRLAEGGANDPGDIEYVDPDGDRWVIEAKHRDRLPVHQAVRKAKRKAGSVDPAPYMTVLVWKRTRRDSEGSHAEGTVVVMDYEDWLGLVTYGRPASDPLS